MDRDERREGRPGDQPASAIGPDQGDRGDDAVVLGAYDTMDGSTVYVIAAIDRDDTWIATDVGVAVDPKDRC